ncbi:MAG: hypothetical protein KJ957_08315 [Candidatus Omnitrophica bacterium]|nr:hypothetical protein [Candidatus Omnitrophota bacterium]
MKDTKKVSIIGIIWKKTSDTLKNNPVIFIPFCISGVIKLFGLLTVFLSIFPPLSVVFAPIIKTLWGEAYLHYPFNFTLMPNLFNYVQIAVYIFMDGLLTGIAVWMICQVNEGKRANLLISIKRVVPKYCTLTAFLFTMFLIMRLIFSVENFMILKLLKMGFFVSFLEKDSLDFIRVYFNFLIVLIIQAGFAFVIPFAILENRNFFKSISESFSLAKRFIRTILILIVLPMSLSLPVSLLETRLPVLMDKTFPEITFLMLAMGVILVVFIDYIVTASLTALFLLRKGLVFEKE